MIVKTAVCVGNGTWLPQVSCGCTSDNDNTIATAILIIHNNMVGLMMVSTQCS